MSYYLTDPYYYLPKSYPYISSQTKHSEARYFNRATTVGWKLETSSINNRYDFASKYYHESGQSEYRLLKNKYNMQNIVNGNQLADTVAYRSNREGSLRRIAHNLPDFIQNRQLIEEIAKQSVHAKPI